MVDSSPEGLVDRLLHGNRRAAGQVISLVEDASPVIETVMRKLYPHTGTAYFIGLTGPPGAGKSTLADELVRVMRDHGQKIGIIAVDPNSPFSGGAILGDRIRMMRHANDQDVFIRSMGARGHLGGLALATRNAGFVLDAMGKDIVLFETVGVGQSELEVADTADTTVVIIPPGQGDGVQAIKAGIMEIADIFVVNKADHPHAGKTVAQIRDLLRMEQTHRAWSPPIVKTVATENRGLEDLWIRIQQHRQHQMETGTLLVRRRRRLQQEVVEIAEGRLRDRWLAPCTETAQFQSLLDMVVARKLDPYVLAEQMVTGK